MNKGLLFFILIICITLVSSCDTTERYEVDIDELQNIYSLTKPTSTLVSDIELYVDYSTCVIEAVSNSAFFSSIRPRITGANPTLFAIKGPVISEISSDKDIVNQELNKITEISYADINGAVDKICNQNKQAILITDGEYWTNPEGERIDLPYMKDSFIKWINKGRVIQVISESYQESYRGKKHSKKRFYFFFTDDKLENNIYEEISKADGFKSADVDFFKMTNSDIKVNRSISVNSNLNSKIDTTKIFDFIEIDNHWKDIYNFVILVTDDDGNQVEGGNPLIENIKIENYDLSNYKINELELKAYNISDQYLDSLHRTS